MNIQPPGRTKEFLSRYFRHPFSWPGVIISAIIVLTAVLAPLIANHPYAQVYSNLGLTADGGPILPAWHLGGFFLGTDQLGRDEFSRLVWAARVSIQVGVFATVISLAIGTVIGVTAGYFRGWVDTVLMRFTDVMLGFPFLFFLILIVTIIGPSLTVIYGAIGAFGWPAMARLARSQTLSVRERSFVEAAQSLGAKSGYIVFRHIVPNILSPVLVLGTLNVASNIVYESTLSFLGIGVPTPIPSWGKMISEGLSYLTIDPYLVLFPAIAISLTVLGFNLLGESLNTTVNGRSGGVR